MKLELSIKTTYLPNWSSYEGIRELLQNGKDAEMEFQAPLKVVQHRDTLTIENVGCTLPHEALLLGHTTKEDRGDLIGKFGEGLKLGVLALVRDGRKVLIRSGDEIWKPSIQKSDKFNANVLVFDITKSRAYRERVAVEVSGISAEEWKMFSEFFLFLMPKEEVEKARIDSFDGALLLGERFAGKVYAKGIFVQNSGMQYGYDFLSVRLDRDRKMVDAWDLKYMSQRIWRDAVSKRPDLIMGYMTLLEQESQDLAGVDDYAAALLPLEVKKQVVEMFQQRYGKDAHPVAALSDSRDLEHLGCKGIVVPKSLRAVLESVMGTAEKRKSELSDEVTHTYSWSELAQEEQQVLECSMHKLTAAVPACTMADVDVVDFRNENLLGRCEISGKIQITKKALVDVRTAIRVLVHEFAHKISGQWDGAKGHVAEIESMWTEIYFCQLGEFNGYPHRYVAV